MHSTPHHYSNGETEFIGRLVWDPAHGDSQPGVLIAPAFGGLGPYEIARAEELAALGYAVLAVDYYGDGKRAGSTEEAFALMGQLNDDRPLLTRRMNCALDALGSLPMVNGRLGAMGYCFGGKCVLDLARSGAGLQAAVSIHGVYDPPAEIHDIKPSVLILHGWDDPLAKPDDLLALTGELTHHCQDWQVLAFGHTGHAFTNPAAQAPEQGMFYSPRAADRSWESLTRFLSERLKG